jgi:hypothetical protein
MNHDAGRHALVDTDLLATGMIEASNASGVNSSASISSREDASKVISEHIRVYCRLKPELREENDASLPVDGGASEGLYLTGADSGTHMTYIFADNFPFDTILPTDDRKGGDLAFVWNPAAAECTYIPPSAAGRQAAATSPPPGSQTFRFNGVFGYESTQEEVSTS